MTFYTFTDVTEYLKENDGVDLSQLQIGTKLTINTRNSIYELEILENNAVKIFGGTLKNGGTRFPQSAPIRFNGSTWGGSAIKANWIGIGMLMEINTGEEVISTSRVQKITIESSNKDWDYVIE